jgi:peptidoglycan/xylan/chitin deacetylase (PgdA/CDA1 family)
LGPDHTGRAIRRAFRPGFIGKVRRTSVVSHYGLRTLLYGTLLPGPHIARATVDIMRSIARRGFEVGVHSYDHVKWQDQVSAASADWTRTEIEKAIHVFHEVFQCAPRVHGAAGGQINPSALALERELGFAYASDVRGESPFIPVVNGEIVGVPQLPTTLPTLDEIVGRPDLDGRDWVEHLLMLTERSPTAHHVYTLHAELEGGRFLQPFQRLLQGWRAQGFSLVSLGEAYASLAREPAAFAHGAIEPGAVPGRSGVVYCQGRHDG